MRFIGFFVIMGLLTPAVALMGADVPRDLHATIRGKLIGCGGDLIEFRSDGAVVVTCGGGMARAWDAKTCKPLGPPVEHNGPVQQCRFVSGGREVVTASDFDAKRWDVAMGKVVASFTPTGGIGEIVGVSADGKFVAGGKGGAVTIYELESARGIRSIPQAGRTACILLSPDGSLLLSGEANGVTTDFGQRFHLWSITDGRERCKPIDSDYSFGHRPQFGQIPAAFTGDSSRLVIAHGSWFEVLDTRDGHRICDNAGFGGDEMKAVALSANDSAIVTVRAASVRTWSITNGQPISPVLSQKVDSFAVEARGKLLAGFYTISGNSTVGRVGVWDLITSNKVCDFDRRGGWCIAFGPGGQSIAVGDTHSEDTTILDLN